MKNFAAIVVIVLSSLSFGCSKQAPAPETSDTGPVNGQLAAAQAALQIDGEYMRAIVKEISDDRYEGRGPGTRGDDAARKYLADQMAALGLQPGAADGSWDQTFDLVGINASQPATWIFEEDGKSLTLKQWEQFIVGSGVQEPQSEISDAELVFVGYGIQAPEFDWDDYKGIDLKGKVLVMMNNDPDWDPELFAGETRLWYGRWDYKYLSAAQQGAAGAIIIHTAPSAGYPFQVVQTSWTGVQFELPAGDEPRSQVKAWITEDSARELVAMAGMDLDELREQAYNRDFKPVPLGITTSIAFDNELTRVTTGNVLGLLPGSDPELKDEVVIYSAHHDHLGIGTPNAEGDAIYNGARDNGSGMALTLAIARAMVALPEAPRRSVLFAFVGAEEQGLLGSEYYANHPTFPRGKIAANINYDSVNIWGHSHDVTYVGLGKSTIDQILTDFATKQNRVVKPDQFADKGYFYRSDQFNFAKIGVPAMYLKAGTDFIDRPPEWGREQQDKHTEEDYHQPTDEYDPSWTFDGMVDDGLLGFWTGLAIANADEMPVWNVGDEFEAARIEALAPAE
ncbi:MAG: M28 family peptidase [Gammaproteobacteria bacterium]|nr:M28 family peptidase [Gammaproteobacteria bacterium]MDH5239175.1 M28 family peptidase [Gammaproteobacteria bacterium]MDH5261995.1 M28 family peptidase [Gammaproteobacteria bacterium]MDH5582418.1 M28 family peptidase [Gammaproteobacteria bacterium]